MDKNLLKNIIFDQREVIKKINIVKRDVRLDPNTNYILVGVRRSGKSWYLYKRVRDLIDNGVDWSQIIYINFDDERLNSFTVNDFNDIIVVANELTDKKKYFYFDEIQNIEGWEMFAKRMADQKYKVDITGSNAKMLSKEMNAKLGGRYICKEIMPFSFNEFLSFNKFDKLDYSTKNISLLNKYINDYLINGGFAECFNMQNKREYLSSIYNRVLLGDIITHYNIRNQKGVGLLISKIAETVGTNVSFSKLHNIISSIGYKLSKDMIIDYCQYSQDAFLLFTLKNYYDSFVDKETKPKYYFVDNGLLHLFANEKNTKLLENLVAIHLLRKYKEELYFISDTKRDIYIDFYLSEQKHVIQVCWQLNNESVDREINSIVKFALNHKNHKKFTIVSFDQKYNIKRSNIEINVVPLTEFLQS